MTQFIVVPSADVNASGAIQSLANSILSNGNVITVSGGVYRAFATADVSVLFTPTGSNFTPGPTVIPGASATQFLVVPDINFDAGGAMTSLANSFVTTSLTVTGLLSGIAYRAVALTAPSDPINTVTAPDAFTDTQWSIADPALGGILVFNFTAVPYDGGSPLTNIYLYQNGSTTPIPTGLSAPGSFNLSGLTNGQSYSYTAAAVNAVGPSTPSFAKAKTPTAPVQPPTNDALVDGLRTGATPCGVQVPIAGMKVVGVDPLPAGISFTSELLIFSGFTGDFDDPLGWNIGSRQVVVNSRFGAFRNVYSLNQIAQLTGNTGTTPGIVINPGGGIDLFEFVTSAGCRAPMILKQESNGILGVVRRCDLRDMTQDAIKVTGTNLIEENLIGPATYRGGAPHADFLTTMAAKGGVVCRNNNVDWTYAGTPTSTGINNWLRIESYQAGNIFDDIDFYGNKLVHSNPTSFAIQVTTKNSPVWNGSVKINSNRMQKAGGLNKILYAQSPQISQWAGNIDMNTGLEIPIGSA